MTNVKFAVLKLATTVEIMGSEHRLCGAAGYIPVFDTEGEAEEAAQDGKYQIAAITLGDPTASTHKAIYEDEV